MKQFITIAALFIIAFTAHAQTTVNYTKVTTDHWKDDQQSSVTTKFTTGTILLSGNHIIIDSASDKRQVYEIVRKGGVDTYDYGDYIQLLTVIYPAKNGTGIKAMEVVFYFDKKMHLTDIILKKTAHSNIDYKLKVN